VDDPSGAAGDARREVVLLEQESAFTGTGAFPSNRHSIDAATDHDHMEMLAFQGSSGLEG
jgi:hypothetical protein